VHDACNAAFLRPAAAAITQLRLLSHTPYGSREDKAPHLKTPQSFEEGNYQLRSVRQKNNIS
jgi:hypothetical protein